MAGALIGATAWSGHLYLLFVLLALPSLLRAAATPSQLAAAILAYNAGATWPLVPGAHVFFGRAFHPFDTLLLWSVAIIVLSLPWILIGHIRLGFAIPLALAIGLVLPTSIESPLTVAGVLFPATAWLGLTLTFIVFGMIAERPRQTLAVAFVVSLFCHVARPDIPAIPAGWSGVDTTFGGSGMLTASPLNLYQTAVSIQSRALDSSATSTVFPESVVRSWNESTDIFWEPTFAELRKRGQTIIVGATVTRSGRNRYRNVLERFHHSCTQLRVNLNHACALSADIS